MVLGAKEKSKGSRGISGLGNKLNVGDQTLERIENDFQFCSLSNGMGWGREVEDNGYGCENMFEFESFTCSLNQNSLQLRFISISSPIAAPNQYDGRTG